MTLIRLIWSKGGGGYRNSLAGQILRTVDENNRVLWKFSPARSGLNITQSHHLRTLKDCIQRDVNLLHQQIKEALR